MQKFREFSTKVIFRWPERLAKKNFCDVIIKIFQIQIKHPLIILVSTPSFKRKKSPKSNEFKDILWSLIFTLNTKQFFFLYEQTISIITLPPTPRTHTPWLKISAPPPPPINQKISPMTIYGTILLQLQNIFRSE